MIRIPGVTLLDAKNSEKSPENYGIYGHYGCGKTALAGDMILYYQSLGKECLYVVTPDEDPYTTLAQFDIGEVVAPAMTMSDLEKIFQGAAKAKVDVVVLDSMKGLYRLAMDKAIGKNKYPVENKEWAPVHDHFTTAVTLWKEAAPISVFLCPADRSTDSFVSPGEKKPNLIACDLPGKMAAGIRGQVSYMGYLTADLDNDTKEFDRKLSFVPEKGILTMARGLVRPMTEPITLNPGFGGNWERVLAALDEHREVQ